MDTITKDVKENMQESQINVKIKEANDFKLANPNEKFNITDVTVYPDKPHQQLCFLANKKNIWRLVYIQGGIGESNKFYEFEINNDTKKGLNNRKNRTKNFSIKYFFSIKKRKHSIIEIIGIKINNFSP